MESSLPKRMQDDDRLTALEPVSAPIGTTGSVQSRPPGAPSANTATERRLRLIIESAPFGLMVLDSGACVLAANRAALALFGFDSPDAILGKSLLSFVVDGDRQRLGAFITETIGGATRSIEYTARGATGPGCTVQTKGVPLARLDAATVVLAATWDITEHKRIASANTELHTRVSTLETERESLRHELRAATDASLAAEAATAEKIEEAVRQAAHDMQTALAHVEHRHALVTGQLSDERDRLQRQLQDAEERAASFSRELSAERDSRQTAMEEAERQRREAVASATERASLEHDLRAELATQETAVAALRSEHEELAQTLRNLNLSYAALAAERAEEQARLNAAVREERLRCAQLLEERDQWRASLADIARAAKETGEQAQQLLEKYRNMRLVVSSQDDRRQDEAAEVTTEQATTSPGEQAWQF